jgi:hypothetical protein
MEFTTAKGVEVKINMADFITSMKLKKAVVEAVKDSGIDIASVDLENLKVGAIDSILQVILTADCSDKVEEAIFKCLSRCTYGGQKITKDIFDNTDSEKAKEAREDYYEIVIACLKENLNPFFAPLFSKLNELQEKMIPSTPEQK